MGDDPPHGMVHGVFSEYSGSTYYGTATTEASRWQLELTSLVGGNSGGGFGGGVGVSPEDA